MKHFLLLSLLALLTSAAPAPGGPRRPHHRHRARVPDQYFLRLPKGWPRRESEALLA